MARYYYPDALNALDAKKSFTKDHHYRANHCFRNIWGDGYVLFDTKADVNAWYKENSGQRFYTEEYETGMTFTKADAINEIEYWYGKTIDELLQKRNYNLHILAVGLPSSTAFGNHMFLSFVKSSNEEDIERNFYIHYNARLIKVSESLSNTTIRAKLIEMLYKHFYNARFKKRIEKIL